MLAPAKVNLSLHVVGRRDDGYHRLESLVAFTRTVGDRLRIETVEGDRVCDEIVVTGRFAAAVPAAADNIARRAIDFARAFLRAEAIALPPLRVNLQKNLPVASGIGGGSSDAGAVLRAIAARFPILRQRLFAKSVVLGADVPMCCENLPALVSGIGDTVEPIAALPELSMLLVNPGVEVSTSAVFAGLATSHNAGLPPLTCADLEDVVALARWLGRTRNDLEGPARAIAPAIGRMHDALVESGALFARMSGSGATVFGLFADPGARDRARSNLAASNPEWWISDPNADAQPLEESNRDDRSMS